MKIKSFAVVLVLFMVLFFSACGAGDLDGEYSGSAYFVNLKYTFKGSNFTAETRTLSDIMIGGGKGTYTLEDGRLSLSYRLKYVFDNNTNSGEWFDDDKTIQASYRVAEDTIVLTTESSGLEVPLKKEL